jgi:hypothetical protein
MKSPSTWIVNAVAFRKASLDESRERVPVRYAST